MRKSFIVEVEVFETPRQLKTFLGKPVVTSKGDKVMQYGEVANVQSRTVIKNGKTNYYRDVQAREVVISDGEAIETGTVITLSLNSQNVLLPREAGVEAIPA